MAAYPEYKLTERRSRRLFRLEYAGIAQSVEQLIRNEQVAGSSPITSSKKNGLSFRIDRFFNSFLFAVTYKKANAVKRVLYPVQGGLVFGCDCMIVVFIGDSFERT